MMELLPSSTMMGHFVCIIVFVCVNLVGAQFLSQPPTFSNIPQSSQLSPQQQGHILSDIQQHQHRFSLNNHFNPQQFSNPTLNPNTIFNPQPSQQSHFNEPIHFPQQPTLNQQILPNQQILLQNQQQFPQPSALPQPILQQSSIILPTNPPLSTVDTPVNPQNQNLNQNRIIQHHTQTSFTPNFALQQNPSFVQPTQNSATTSAPIVNPFQPRPTIDPILAIEHQIQQLDPEKHKLRIKELREKQAIIEKHNQFVEKQYEKALKKAQADHQEFLEQQKEQKKKLYQRVYKPHSGNVLRYSQSIPRFIYPEEAPLFKLAIDKYYEEHPTTTTTTTTTTTPAPPTTTTEKKEKKKSKANFLPTVLPATESDSKIRTIQSLEDLTQLQKQYKSQQIAKDDLLAQLRLAISGSPEENLAKNLSSREISTNNNNEHQFQLLDAPGKTQEFTLPNGQKVRVIHQYQEAPKTDEVTLPSGQRLQVVNPNSSPSSAPSAPSSSSTLNTQEITLPNGEKVEIIRTTDPKSVPGATPLEPGSELEKLVFAQTTTSKPPKIILDELTKGVIPKGSNFELLKTGASGGLEQIDNIPQNLPNQKKVTFVLLEEQEDGSLKVQGVKSNGKEKSEVDVDSILKRIKNGEIKLPNVKPTTATTSSTTTPKPTNQRSSFSSNSFTSDEDIASIPILKTNIGTHFVATSTPSSTLYTKIFPNTVRSTTPTPTTTTKKVQRILNHPTNDLVRQASSSSSSSQNALYSKQTQNYQTSPRPTQTYQTTTRTVPTSTTVKVYQSISSTAPAFTSTYNDLPLEPPKQIEELPEVLKKNGLFAMAKFLRQSGLDTILNETGPYTIFVPTDKAFRTLLVQLGGPEKAEEKFKENPRLLSGLLLHHVIPGAFTIDSLQDEMTGVSLAGTQLRVNQYNMHDLEWNDIKITTINGAKVLDDKKDLEIPQGIAHAVDRVMFPLPVGDIVQTLQSDRERRFTSFLRALFSSGLAETLQGTKTFTLFAPTEKAFSHLSTEELGKLVTDRTQSRELVLKHLTPTTLYTNGMRYYQIKDSMLGDKTLTLSKQSGKVKVNNIQLSTQNIPATNGVIHAIDTLL